MRKRYSLIVGVACGCACALCLFVYSANVDAQAEQARSEALARYGGEQVEVCVASRDIAAGETVSAADIDVRLWVADLLPRDSVANIKDIEGRQATSSILAGEVISLQRFEQSDAALEVPEGMTALSVPAQNVQAVGGAIAPGMKVDIYATGSSSTTLIASGVAVLATSASASPNEQGEVAWITFAVKPEAVEELVSAAETMELYFVLPGQKVVLASEKDGEEGNGDKARSDEEKQREQEGSGQNASDAEEPKKSVALRG